MFGSPRTRIAAAAILSVFAIGTGLTACAPQPPSGTTTTTSTTTTPPRDSDGDGIPDPEDACPFAADPDGYCPVTPYQLANATQDSLVRLDHVLVTGVNSGGATAFVAILRGDPGYNGPEHSAVEVQFLPPDVPMVGDRITLRAVVGSPQFLEASSYSTDATGEVPVATPLPDLPVDDLAWHGVLVSTGPTTVVSHDASRWTLANGVVVNSFLLPTLPPVTDGMTINSLVGVAGPVGGYFFVNPRTAADIT